MDAWMRLRWAVVRATYRIVLSCSYTADINVRGVEIDDDANSEDESEVDSQLVQQKFFFQ